MSKEKKRTVLLNVVDATLKLLKTGSNAQEIDAAFFFQKTQVQKESSNDLSKIAGQIENCTKCRLSEKRTRAVPGEGAQRPLVLVVGEAPGAEEDRTGRPFVGRAGQYLDKWLNAIQLSRKKNTFIANIVKCRPPQNRDPQEAECEICSQYLFKQIEILQPVAMFSLGRIATHFLTKRWGEPMSSLRRAHLSFEGIPMIATYHPSSVLRNPSYRGAVWTDLQKLQKILREKIGNY